MVITLGPDLEEALSVRARQEGVEPAALALNVLRVHLLGTAAQLQPRDDWERRLLAAATDCGVALSHQALSSEGIYD